MENGRRVRGGGGFKKELRTKKRSQNANSGKQTKKKPDRN